MATLQTVLNCFSNISWLLFITSLWKNQQLILFYGFQRVIAPSSMKIRSHKSFLLLLLTIVLAWSRRTGDGCRIEAASTVITNWTSVTSGHTSAYSFGWLRTTISTIFIGIRMARRAMVRGTACREFKKLAKALCR